MAILGIDLSTLDLASITENIFFFILASIVIGGALGLIYAQRVAHSMMALIFCFMGVAGIFILMSAELRGLRLYFALTGHSKRIAHYTV